MTLLCKCVCSRLRTLPKMKCFGRSYSSFMDRYSQKISALPRIQFSGRSYCSFMDHHSQKISPFPKMPLVAGSLYCSLMDRRLRKMSVLPRMPFFTRSYCSFMDRYQEKMREDMNLIASMKPIFRSPFVLLACVGNSFKLAQIPLTGLGVSWIALQYLEGASSEGDLIAAGAIGSILTANSLLFTKFTRNWIGAIYIDEKEREKRDPNEPYPVLVSYVDVYGMRVNHLVDSHYFEPLSKCARKRWYVEARGVDGKCFKINFKMESVLDTDATCEIFHDSLNDYA